MAKKKEAPQNVLGLPVVHEVFKDRFELKYINELRTKDGEVIDPLTFSTDDMDKLDLADILAPFEDAVDVMTDTETSGLDTFNDTVSIVQLSPNPKLVVVIDVLELGDVGWELTRMCLKDKKSKYWNMKFDVKIMREFEHNEPWKVGIDLMILRRTLYQGKRSLKHSLAAAVEHELDMWLSKDEQVSNWMHRPLNIEQLTYAACDVAVMWPLDKIIIKKLKAKPNVYKACQIEVRFLPALIDAERHGMPVNIEKAEKVTKEFQRELILLEDEVKRGLDVNKEFNIRSPKQLVGALSRYVKQDLDGTGDAILAYYDKPEFEAIGKLRKYRSIQKLYKYAEDLTKKVRLLDPNTGFGVINTNYWQYGTVVGRISSSKPNVQNPSRDPRIRGLFEAPPGFKILGCDWSALHGRIVASSRMSNDPVLQDIFNTNDDWYIRTAKSILESEGISWDSLTPKEQKEWRQRTKAVCLGFLFGMYPDKFVVYAKSTFGLDYTEKEASKFRTGFFDLYSGLTRFHKKLIHSGYSNGRSYTLGGHEIYHETKKITDFLNWCVIGTEAEIFKVAAHRIHKELIQGSDYKYNTINFIHDEILMMIPDEDVSTVKYKNFDLWDAGKKGQFILDPSSPDMRIWVNTKTDQLNPKPIADDPDIAATLLYTSPVAGKVEEIMCGAFSALIPDITPKAEPSMGQSWADAK